MNELIEKLRDAAACQPINADLFNEVVGALLLTQDKLDKANKEISRLSFEFALNQSTIKTESEVDFNYDTLNRYVNKL